MVKVLSLIFAALLLPVDLTYACMENGATLYERNGESYRVIAVLPKTYYCAVLRDAGDGYALVSYLDISGYVKTDELSKVDFVPKVKYSSPAFVVSNDSQPANLRSRPERLAGTVLAVMPDGSGGVCIGTASGEELVRGAGTLWYYVRYETDSGYVYGYVYSAHVRAESFGVNDGARESTPSYAAETDEGRPVAEMSPVVRAIVISVLCLPVVVALFMLRPKKRAAQTKA